MNVFVEKFAFFVPTEEQPKPDVSFVPMLTRRRLSSLSKMVVAVNNQVAKDLPNCKITFASQFGEISQQLKISQTFLETGTVSPAHFSLSVFNTSVANATILEKNTAGYSAVFSGKEAFNFGLNDCVAALTTGSDTERIFIFADELIPETYAPILGFTYPNKECAVAVRFTTDKSKGLFELDYKAKENKFNTAAENALEFINWLKGKC